LSSRWIDPEKSTGNLEPGQTAFGSQETIIEYGLPYSRRYDAAEELDRIRHIYAREAAAPTRRAQPPFVRHSLRRV
jgi:hypothetical protein